MKVLLIEDDPTMGEFLATVLTTHRYTVDTAVDGQTGLELASLWQYDVILLDLDLPKLDGISVCRELRYRANTTPILMLTVKNDNQDVVVGLDAGADDYMSKPCDPHQLLARMRALLRRGTPVLDAILSWGELALNPALTQVTYQQQPLALGPKEYQLLELFLRHPQRVFTRSAILDHLWTVDDCPTESAVTNLIKDLRRKLKQVGMAADIIETLYGLGYRLRQAPELPDSMSIAPPLPLPSPASPSPDAEGVAAIAALASQFQATLGDRLTQLETQLRSRLAETLADRDRDTARRDAHRLAGVLGMFGYDHGTEMAIAVEHALAVDPVPPSQIEQALHALCHFRQTTLAPPDPSPAPVAVPLPIVLLLADPVAGDRTLAALQSDPAAAAYQLQVIALDRGDTLDWTLQFPTPPIALCIPWTSDPHPAAIAQMRHCREQCPLTPMIIWSDADDLTTRVRAAQLGCQVYLHRPSPAQIWQAIALSAPAPAPAAIAATVLVMTADPPIQSAIATLLHPWGMQTMGLSEPTEFWNRLTQVNPDLVLLDVDLPQFSGVDLCRVVRQDMTYAHLPIVMITAHHEIEHVQAVFAAGADDLVYKPLVGAELTRRVVSRLERERWRRSQIADSLPALPRSPDPPRPLPQRHQFDQWLAQAWQRHQQTQTPLALIVCQIHACPKEGCLPQTDPHPTLVTPDDAAGWNDCLPRVAQILQSRVHQGVDRVAQYSRDRIGIILPNTDLNGALQVARRIQTALPSPLAAPDQRIHLSMGITGTIPSDRQTLEQLLDTAEHALAAAQSRDTPYCLYPLTE